MGGSTRKKVKKQSPTPVNGSNIRKAILKSVEKLLIVHAEDINKTQAESEQNIISIAFTAKVDGSEAQTVVKTKIKFSATVTDSLTVQMDDPNQGTLQFISGDAEPDDPEKEVEEEEEKSKEVEVPVKD